MRASLTEVAREQWNFNITKGQGIGKISEICSVYVIPRFFSNYGTIQPMNYQQSVLAYRRLFTHGAVKCLSISGDTLLNSIMAYIRKPCQGRISVVDIYLWKVREICHLAIWEGLHVIKIFTDVWKMCDQEKKTTVNRYLTKSKNEQQTHLNLTTKNPKQRPFFTFYSWFYVLIVSDISGWECTNLRRGLSWKGSFKIPVHKSTDV